MKLKIKESIKKDYPGIDFDVACPPKGYGDYSTNLAFLLAKKKNKDLKKVAQELIVKFEKKFKNEFEKIAEVNGFINFYLKPSFLQKQLEIISKNKNYFKKRDLGKGKTIIVEYSQPNIAKFMHVGHLRSTIVGDAFSNIFEFLGYKVVRWNYLGDWGTQFGRLIAAYKLWGEKKQIKDDPIKNLNSLYVKFHEEMKSRPELEELGKKEFKKLEDGDKENKKLWDWFKKESLKEFNKIYRLLGVDFDTYIGESFYEKELKPLVKKLLKDGLARESESAVIIPLDKFNLPPALIQKSDGTSLYLLRDIANLIYRIKKYKPAKILYVVGNEQSLHFQQLFGIAKILNLKKTELVHIKFGLVLSEERKKLATREGKTIYLKELIEKALNLAKKIIEEKNPGLSEKEKSEISQMVAIGAIKYNDLKEHRNTDIIFDWDKMLDFSGNSGPYLQYTFARLMSIKRKAGKIGKSNFSTLAQETELPLLKKILDFQDVAISSGEAFLTNNLALYLYELANLTNQFYESVPILKDDNLERRNARLNLIDVVANLLKNGLELLGIKTLEKI